MRSQLLVLALVVAACALLFGRPPASDSILLGESVKDLQARLGPGDASSPTADGTRLIHYGRASAILNAEGVVVGLTGVDVTTGGRSVRRRDTRERVRETLGKPVTSKGQVDWFDQSDCRIQAEYDDKDRLMALAVIRR